MNQEKIGKFIAERRKIKKITQANLAEKLNITDRAISKWENGKSMPDSSIMLELCNILEISVNELLSGELINMNDYDKKAEENLLDLKKQKEEADKKLLDLEWVIGYMASVTFIIFVMLASYVIEDTILRVLLIILGFIIFIVGMFWALKIETEAGYYKCKNCNYKYVPEFKSVLWAMHMGRTRKLKCPKCGKKTWNKKVLSKE